MPITAAAGRRWSDASKDSVRWLNMLESKELDHRGARATGLLQAMVEFVGEAPASRTPDDRATDSTAEFGDRSVAE